MADQAAAPTPIPTALESIPKVWPGGFGAYKYSKKAVMVNLSVIILIFVISLALSILLSAIFNKNIAQLLTDIVSLYLGIVSLYAYLAGTRDEKLDFQTACKKVKPMMLLNYLGLSILMGLALLVSFIALIIPFFFVLPRIILAPYYLVDKNMSITDAFSASWQATKGQYSKIWGIIGVGFCIGLLAVTIIGIPFAIYFGVMYSAIFAVFYGYINAQPQTAVAPANTPVATPAAS